MGNLAQYIREIQWSDEEDRAGPPMETVSVEIPAALEYEVVANRLISSEKILVSA